MNHITIYSARTVKSLLRAGFHILDIEPNTKVKNATLFLFDDTDEIREFLKEKHNINIPSND